MDNSLLIYFMTFVILSMIGIGIRRALICYDVDVEDFSRTLIICLAGLLSTLLQLPIVALREESLAKKETNVIKGFNTTKEVINYKPSTGAAKDFRFKRYCYLLGKEYSWKFKTSDKVQLVIDPKVKGVVINRSINDGDSWKKHPTYCVRFKEVGGFSESWLEEYELEKIE